MKIIKVIQLILAMASGVLVMMYGEVDDSPEAEGIGLLTIIASLVIAVSMFLSRKVKNDKDN